MTTSEETRFSDLVASAFSADQEGAQTLWLPLRDEFERHGPDAVKVYLEAQRQRLIGDVEKLLSQVKGKING